MKVDEIFIITSKASVYSELRQIWFTFSLENKKRSIKLVIEHKVNLREMYIKTVYLSVTTNWSSSLTSHQVHHERLIIRLSIQKKTSLDRQPQLNPSVDTGIYNFFCFPKKHCDSGRRHGVTSFTVTCVDRSKLRTLLYQTLRHEQQRLVR